MLINFAKGSKMFDGVFIASLNGIVSILVKEVEKWEFSPRKIP